MIISEQGLGKACVMHKWLQISGHIMTTPKISLLEEVINEQLFFESDVIIGEYSPIRQRGELNKNVWNF